MYERYNAQYIVAEMYYNYGYLLPVTKPYELTK